MQNKFSVNRLSMRSAFCILVLIHISNSIILGYPSGVANDSWIAQLLSIVAVAPLLLVYARLIRLMPGKNLFEMMDELFGKHASWALSVLYVYYFLTMSAVVRIYYAQFVHIAALINTSLVIILLSFFMVCTYLVKSGAEAFGKWSTFMLVVAVSITGLLTIFCIPQMDLRNLLPVGTHSWGEMAQATVKFVPLPLGEAVVLLTLADGLDRKANPYKLFFGATIFSILFFTLLFVRNCAVLGEMTMDTMNYTSFKAASVIQIGPLGMRVEALVAITFIMTGITKVSAALYASCRGVKRVFNIKEENSVVLPVCLFSVAMSSVIFPNLMKMFEYVDVYMVYAPVFQLLIPTLLWAVAEYKAFRARRAHRLPPQSSAASS